MEKQIRTWELKAHNNQIADTGDYDGVYELTDGVISLVCREDVCGEDAARATAALNELDVNWENWKHENLNFELHLEKDNTKRWKEIARMLYEDVKFGFSPLQPNESLAAYDEAEKNLPDPDAVKSLLLRLKDIEGIARQLRNELARGTEYEVEIKSARDAVQLYDRYAKVTEVIS